jgi:hypothetical protein
MLELEREDLEREVHGKKVALVFDGTPRMGDGFTIFV